MLTKNFSVKEFQCPCCGACNMQPEFMDILQKIRDRIAKPMRITRGYRCENYNSKIGGADKSYHTHGLAADIRARSSSQRGELIKAALDLGIMGVGCYSLHIHCDLRPTKKPQAWAGMSK
jgi:uncharacterized protein YcbK (DUF882 family)